MEFTKRSARERTIAGTWLAAGIALNLLVIAESVAALPLSCPLRVANYGAFGALPILVAAVAKLQQREFAKDGEPGDGKVDLGPIQVLAIVVAGAGIAVAFLLVIVALAAHILGFGGVIALAAGLGLGLLVFFTPVASQRSPTPQNRDPAGPPTGTPPPEPSDGGPAT